MTSPEAPDRKTGSQVLLCSMAFAVFTTVTAVAMLGPLLVDMSSALDTTVPVVGQLVTISAASWAISALLVGPFSDTYGRKPVLVLGSLLVAVAS
ncbi:MAG: MFS transporter, partial [Dehalococcoidia bacterium]|nr:MFS transporter [Dehalococcoidia bacterium]